MLDLPIHYILEDRTVKKVDFLTWVMWYQQANRTIARTEIGNVVVSTVFFGLDFSLGNEEFPELFETMILGGESDGAKVRSSTWEQAEELHERYVNLVKAEEEDHTLDAEVIG